MDSLQTKTEKLLKYGKIKLSEKGVESAATDIRGVLDDIGNIDGQLILQEKNIAITDNRTTEITADNGYNGLSKVKVNVNVQPTLQEKGVIITDNSTTEITADSNYDGLTKVNVEVNVQPILQEKSVAIRENGTTEVIVDNDYDGLARVNIETSVQPTLQEKNITVTENGITEVIADQGYDGLSKVNIEANIQDIRLLNIIKAMNSYKMSDRPFELTEDMWDENSTEIYQNKYAFNYNITKVTIPNNIKSIGRAAFYDCRNMTSIIIPSDITILVTYVLAYCRNLQIVDFRRVKQVPTVQTNSFLYVPYTCKFIIPDELYDSWKVATNWADLYAKGYPFIKESDYPTEGLAYILNSDSTSYNCSGIGTATDTNITFAKTYNNLPVTTIKHDAFRDNYNITKIVIPNSITTLGDHSFYGCLNLATAKFANDIQLSTIDKFAFAYSGITSIEIPNSGVEIKGAAFSDCTQLTNIVLPDSVSIVETGIFANCTSLSNIQLPNTMTNIPAYTFKGCSGLTNITIPSQVTTIGSNAFRNCNSLVKIDCTNVTSVPILEDQYVFNGISSTCKIVVPDALYDEWVTVTNWVMYTSQIVKASEYTEA